MRAQKQGVAGFYVDLPALLAIMIGISIFTISIYGAHTSYLERRQEGKMNRQLDNFVRDLRSYSYLAISPGVFRADRLNNLNISYIEETYPSETLGFHYQINIDDNSGYRHDHSVSFSTSPIPYDRDVYAKSTSVLIQEGSGRTHLARMTVYIWGVSP